MEKPPAYEAGFERSTRSSEVFIMFPQDIRKTESSVSVRKNPAVNGGVLFFRHIPTYPGVPSIT